MQRSGDEIIEIDAHKLGAPRAVSEIERVRMRSDVPVLVYCTEDDAPQMLDAGADDCVYGEISADELSARKGALLRRCKQMRFKNTRVNTARITIDLSSSEVSVANSSVSLAPAEYRALVHLALNAGELVMRDALMMRVISDGAWRSGHLVNMHLYNLRKKLGKAVNIVTVPRRGFVLEC